MKILGLDIGTSSTKAIVVDFPRQTSVTFRSRPYQTLHPQEDWSEQNPLDWLSAVESAARGVLDAADRPVIDAIAFTGQMHGLVLVDAALKPLRNALIWADQRSRAEATWLSRRFGSAELLRRTGSWATADYLSAKLMWVLRHDSTALDEAKFVFTPKDWVRTVLGGRPAIDVTDASGTGLLNLGNRRWDQTIIDAIGFDSRLLPEVRSAAGLIGTLNRDWAARLGLRPETPLVLGAGDLPAASLASGLECGQGVQVNAGSAGQVVKVMADGDTLPKQVQIFAHPAPQRRLAVATLLAAGLTVSWVRGLAKAAGPMPPADRVPELLFVPHLQGQRSPQHGLAGRGAVFSIGVDTNAEELMAGAAYGVVCAYRELIENLTGGDVTGRVVLTSEAKTSKTWARRLANVLDRPVDVLVSPSPSAYGAALLGGVATKGLAWPDIRALTTYVTVEPTPLAARRAERLYEAYCMAAPRVREISRLLARVGES